MRLACVMGRAAALSIMLFRSDACDVTCNPEHTNLTYDRGVYSGRVTELAS